MVFSILSALLLVAILVFIHEFGHFIVAKWCGVHVQVLSIGYGRRLIGFVFRGTDYRLSLIPFGGYVRMSGADPFGEGYEDDLILEDPQQSFMRKPVWKRLSIVAAGPLFNLLLPIVAFTFLFMAGEPQPIPNLGRVKVGSIVAEAGLLPSDRIVAIDNEPVQTWGQLAESLDIDNPANHSLTVQRGDQEIQTSLLASSSMGLEYFRSAPIIGVDNPNSPAGLSGLKTGDKILKVDGQSIHDFYLLQVALEECVSCVLEILRDEEQLTLTFVKTDWEATHVLDNWFGINQNFGIFPATIFVQSVSENLDLDASVWFLGDSTVAPAYRAGLKAGDRLLRLDDLPIYSWGDVLDAVDGAMEGEGETASVRALNVEVVRDGELIIKELSPVIIRDTTVMGEYRYRPLIGVLRDGDLVEPPMEPFHYTFVHAVQKATSDTLFISGLIIEQLGKLVTGKVAVEKSIGGPVEIVRQASKAAEEGIFKWFRMMAMLSISLGIVNLLPVPVLDGGQILFYSIEGIRGRPLSLKVREIAQQAGVLFLVLLMLFVLVLDIGRLFGGG